MEVVRIGRSSREANISPDRAKLVATRSADPLYNRRGRQHNHNHNHNQEHQQYRQHPLSRTSVVKMFNKVQVVYYLTRNGHLEHPHYLEVSHLATQPLRLRDVIDRLTVLRGKAMPCQYAWSCKRSYKNGYVWNDLTENDIIYASDGSEYVLKGSEFLQDRDFSEIREEELQNKGRQLRKNGYVKPKSDEMMINKEHSFRQAANNSHQAYKSFKHSNANEVDDEEEEKASCNSSDAPYPYNMHIEQEESFSLPSTSSTNSDKQPLPAPLPARTSESGRFEKEIAVDENDGNNPSVLLQLIACGGGSASSKAKAKSNVKGNNKNFNLDTMRSTIIPCLKQQLSTSTGRCMSNRVPLLKETVEGGHHHQNHDDHVQVTTTKEEDDEDMVMVRYMSENPRFGNLQSEEKEYFSGTIVETVTHNHPPVLTKSSSYNEQRRSKAGLQQATARIEVEEDKEKEGVKMKGFIKCIPRKKSCLSSSSKPNKI